MMRCTVTPPASAAPPPPARSPAPPCLPPLWFESIHSILLTQGRAPGYRLGGRGIEPLTGRRDGLTGRRDGSQRETAGVNRSDRLTTAPCRRGAPPTHHQPSWPHGCPGCCR